MATTFTLHGMRLSTCTRRVALIAKERNIPYVLNAIDIAKGEQKKESYKEHQPFGQVPYITVRSFPSLPSLP